MTCLLDYLPIYQYAMQGKPKRQDSSFIKKNMWDFMPCFVIFQLSLSFFFTTFTWRVQLFYLASKVTMIFMPRVTMSWNWKKSCTIPLVSLLFYMAKEVQIVQWHIWQDLFIWCYSLSCLGISLFIAIAITYIVKALRLSKYDFFELCPAVPNKYEF